MHGVRKAVGISNAKRRWFQGEGESATKSVLAVPPVSFTVALDSSRLVYDCHVIVLCRRRDWGGGAEKEGWQIRTSEHGQHSNKHSAHLIQYIQLEVWAVKRDVGIKAAS
jgi:hypothetical protein